MQKQKLILPIAIILAMTFVVTIVSAAVESSIGPGGIIIGGNYSSSNFLVNCTTASDADDCEGCLNATIQYASDGGDAVNGTTLCTIVNNTDDDITFMSSENSACATAYAALTEVDNTPGYNFTCSFYNKSETGKFPVINASYSIWNVGVDNTAPTVTLSADYSSVNLGRYFKYTISISDATTGLNTESTYVYCNMTDAEGDVDKDGVISTSASGTDFKHTDVAGDYVISCTATDYAGNVATDTETVTAKTTGAPIQVGDGEGFSITGLTDKLKDLSQTQMVIGLAVIIGLAIMFGKKKG